MKKLASLGFVALLVVLLGPTATAQETDPPRIQVAVDRHAVQSGRTLTVTGVSSVECEWVLEWNGVRKHAVGQLLVTTFTAPSVTRPRKIPLRALCIYGRAAATSGATTPTAPERSMIELTIPDNWQQTIPVNVVPGGAVAGEDDGSGHHEQGAGLPDTGGPPRWPIALGAALALAGVQLLRRARTAGSRR